MLIPSGFAEVTWIASVASGYRQQMTSLAFAIAGFDPVAGPNTINGYWQIFIGAIGWNTGSPIQTVIKVGTADPSAPLTYESGATTAGSGANQVTQPQVSVLATKTTLLGGRKGRGRMFLPQPLEDQVDKTGLLDSTYRSNYQTALDTMISGTETTIGGSAYLLHTDATPPTLIQDVLVQAHVATQRRRNSRP